MADVFILQVLLLLTLVDDEADATGRHAPSSVMLTCNRVGVGGIDDGEYRVSFPAKPLTCIFRVYL